MHSRAVGRQGLRMTQELQSFIATLRVGGAMIYPLLALTVVAGCVLARGIG